MGKTTTDMQLVPIGKLVPYANNARTHSKEQVTKLRSSLREFGFINPVIIDRDYGIIAGHGRVMATKEEGITDVPCVFVDHLTEAQKKAYILADNRFALDAGWDEELLRVEIEALQGMDFDIGLTGFDEKELADLFAADDGEAKEDDFDVEAELEKTCISKPGDIWHLGKHRVICGDSTLPETYQKLLGEEKVNLVCTDAPYFVNLDSASGKIKNDDLDDKSAYEFLMKVFANFKNAMSKDASIYEFYATMKARIFYDAFEDAGFKVGAGLIWKKPRAPFMRTDWKFNSEPIIFGWRKDGKHIWYGDQKQTNVFEFDGIKNSKADGFAGMLTANNAGRGKNGASCACHGTRPSLAVEGNQRMPGKDNFHGILQPFGISSHNSNAMRSDNPKSGIYEATTSRTLDQKGGDPACQQGGVAIVSTVDVRFTSEGTKNARQNVYETNTARTLDTGGNAPESNQGGIAVVAIQGSMIGRKDENGPQGSGINENVSFTLNATDRHAVFAMTTGGYTQVEKEKAPTLMSRDYKDPAAVCCGIGRDVFNAGANAKFAPSIDEELQPPMTARGPGAVQQGYAVRRLTPTECARLQGFPDWWCSDLGTENPTAEEMEFWRDVFETHRKVMGTGKKPKTDNQIRKWLANPHTDSAEYRMWGNGCSVPIVFYVLFGIAHFAKEVEPCEPTKN